MAPLARRQWLPVAEHRRLQRLRTMDKSLILPELVCHNSHKTYRPSLKLRFKRNLLESGTQLLREILKELSLKSMKESPYYRRTCRVLQPFGAVPKDSTQSRKTPQEQRSSKQINPCEKLVK